MKIPIASWRIDFARSIHISEIFTSLYTMYIRRPILSFSYAAVPSYSYTGTDASLIIISNSFQGAQFRNIITSSVT